MKITVKMGGLMLCVMVMLCAGCGGDGGPKTHVIKGKVTKGGQAVTVPAEGRGIIEFTELVDGAPGDRVYAETLNPDGSYQVEVSAGKYRVSVVLKDTLAGPDTLAGAFNSANSTIEKDVTGPATGVDIDLVAK